MLIHYGSWTRAQLSTSRVASTFQPDAVTEARVEAAWKAAGARLGTRLFDGPVCRVERITATPTALHVAWSASSYRWFLGTNGSDAALLPRADALGTCAVVVSSDGWLVFGRRSAQVALYPGRAHPFGGMVEPAEAVDLCAEIERELHEEVGLTPADVSTLTCLGVGVDPQLAQPELIFAAQTKLARAELVARLTQGEHSACWCVAANRSAIDEALTADDLTPVTRMVLERYRSDLP